MIRVQSRHISAACRFLSVVSGLALALVCAAARADEPANSGDAAKALLEQLERLQSDPGAARESLDKITREAAEADAKIKELEAERERLDKALSDALLQSTGLERRLNTLRAAQGLLRAVIGAEPGAIPTVDPDATKSASREMQVSDKDRGFRSFRPLAAVSPPDSDSPWVRNDIDRFILASLEGAGLAPNPEADRRELIRRVTFDLTGLPPTPEEMAAYLADDAPDAYERVVDRLLASPHFGERWARHWLDVARYADSAGYEFDFERPTAYHYRDFVIKAFNEDMPYDRFVKWQLAGDEYEPDNPMAIAATGFVAAGPTVGNQESEQNFYDELDDMASTTASAFLGLTMACARCHDHKYDPIPSRDYYRMLAAFTTVKREDSFLVSRVEKEEYEEKLGAWRRRLSEAKRPLDDLRRPIRETLREEKIKALPLTDAEKELLRKPSEKDNAEQMELKRKFGESLKVSDEEIQRSFGIDEIAVSAGVTARTAAIEKEAPLAPPAAMAVTDKKAEPDESFLLARGNVEIKQEPVQLGFLSVLPGNDSPKFQPAVFKPAADAATTYQRTALAEWLTNVDEGAGRLAARVIVNRLWMHHFGLGIVGTPNDFGTQGDPPSHPELLDWLARDLIEHGWTLKRLHKLMVMSAAYRQSSAFDEARSTVDPANRLLWRRTPQRLEAESIRDAMLAATGKLNPAMYGPGVFPFMHPDAIATGSTGKWPKDAVDGPESWRRSVYVYIRRSAMLPMIEAFDLPPTVISCARRSTTTTPTQALALMNSSFVQDQARYLAERLRTELGDDKAAWVRRGHDLALARPPRDAELAAATAFLERQAAGYGSMEKALVDYCQVLLGLNEFVYVN